MSDGTEDGANCFEVLGMGSVDCFEVLGTDAADFKFKLMVQLTVLY